MNYKPNVILIDKAAEKYDVTKKILSRFSSVELKRINDPESLKKPTDFSKGKKNLLITVNKGNTFKPCQGIGEDYNCCNYWIMDLISNCPMECSYCILQYYLINNPLLTIYANIDEIINEAVKFVKNNSSRFFRIGTGELSDSLALDDITGFSTRLIEAFSELKNTSVELKTKSNNIEHLLDIENKGNAVLSWSVNPQSIIDSEERNTASLNERFTAAEKAICHNYKIGFHFDPIIHFDNWEEEYYSVVKRITDEYNPEDVAWISIGTLRYPPRLKDIATRRFPDSRIFYGELVPVSGKMRYFRPLREKVYSRFSEWFRSFKESVPVYFCMETPLVWNKFDPEHGSSNRSIEKHVSSAFIK